MASSFGFIERIISSSQITPDVLELIENADNLNLNADNSTLDAKNSTQDADHADKLIPNGTSNSFNQLHQHYISLKNLVERHKQLQSHMLLLQEQEEEQIKTITSNQNDLSQKLAEINQLNTQIVCSTFQNTILAPFVRFSESTIQLTGMSSQNQLSQRQQIEQLKQKCEQLERNLAKSQAKAKSLEEKLIAQSKISQSKEGEAISHGVASCLRAQNITELKITLQAIPDIGIRNKIFDRLYYTNTIQRHADVACWLQSLTRKERKELEIKHF